MKLKKIDKILFAWIIIVFVAIAWPSPDVPEITRFEFSDKIVHMILFGVVAFLLNESLAARGIEQRGSMFIGLLGGSLYAGFAEIIQIFVPGRECSLYDFYAGVLGAVIAVIIICIRALRYKRRPQESS